MSELWKGRMTDGERKKHESRRAARAEKRCNLCGTPCREEKLQAGLCPRCFESGRLREAGA